MVESMFNLLIPVLSLKVLEITGVLSLDIILFSSIKEFPIVIDNSDD